MVGLRWWGGAELSRVLCRWRCRIQTRNGVIPRFDYGTAVVYKFGPAGISNGVVWVGIAFVWQL